MAEGPRGASVGSWQWDSEGWSDWLKESATWKRLWKHLKHRMKQASYARITLSWGRTCFIYVCRNRNKKLCCLTCFFSLLETALFCKDSPLAWLERIRWYDPDLVERNSWCIKQKRFSMLWKKKKTMATNPLSYLLWSWGKWYRSIKGIGHLGREG